MTILIKAENINKSYPNVVSAKDRFKSFIALLFNKQDKNKTKVLQDISFEVSRGESLAIIGKNGAGKSTLLKIISGVIKASSGKITVDASIGALLELGAGFHPEYTGRENLRMSATLSGLSSKKIERSISKMIKFADIGDYIDHPVKTYSSGMVVRLGFSIVTVTKPDLLITDEVLAVGDTDFQRKCIEWIDGYLEEGGTLLLVSHSIYHVQKLCKKAIWLENGLIKKIGDSYIVSQEYQSFYDKNNISKINSKTDLSNYHVKELKLLDDELNDIVHTETNKNIVIKIKIYSPDNRPPGVALGIMKGEFPVYGTGSDLFNAKPKMIVEKLYEYTISLPNLKLLPADYTIRAHAMDPECLRLMDTMEASLRVHSQTHELGVVQIETVWS